VASRTISRRGARALTTTAMACVLAASAAGAAHAVNRVAWVWGNDPSATSAYTPDGDYSYDSTGGAAKIKPIGTGKYEVTFTRIDSGYTDNVQVSAYDTNGYCISAGWYQAATTVEAYVYCYDANGNAANSYFTLLYQSRSAPLGASGRGIAFLWANGLSTASYTPDTRYNYNSTGVSNTITRSSTGVYTVNIPGLSYEADVQVTAYGSAPARCKVIDWGTSGSGVDVNVACFNSSGNPADEYFNLAYTAREAPALTAGTDTLGAYAWTNEPTNTSGYKPYPVYQYNAMRTGPLTSVEISTGAYEVQIPGSYSVSSDNVLVTAYGSNSDYCNVGSWGSDVMYIYCYSQGGTPANDPFDVSFQTW